MAERRSAGVTSGNVVAASGPRSLVGTSSSWGPTRPAAQAGSAGPNVAWANFKAARPIQPCSRSGVGCTWEWMEPDREPRPERLAKPGSSAYVRAMQWENKVRTFQAHPGERINWNVVNRALLGLGRQGWELVSVQVVEGEVVCAYAEALGCCRVRQGPRNQPTGASGTGTRVVRPRLASRSVASRAAKPFGQLGQLLPSPGKRVHEPSEVLGGGVASAVRPRLEGGVKFEGR